MKTKFNLQTEKILIRLIEENKKNTGADLNV